MYFYLSKSTIFTEYIVPKACSGMTLKGNKEGS